MFKKFITKGHFFILSIVGTFAIGSVAFANETAAAHGPGLTLLWVALILVAAKVSGLIERWGQPSVLGELLVGVLLGNLTLIGIGIFEPIKQDVLVAFLAQIGVIILLFQVGLESNITRMKQVGVPALLVATVGVVLPFVLGTYLVGPYLLPGLSMNAYLFLGATLTATSVGITARVFRDLGKLQTPEAQIVLGAAVIDDVMGLIILAVVSAIVTAGFVSATTVAIITLKAVLFLVLAIVIGQLAAPYLGRVFSSVSNGTGMKFTLAIAFCFIIAFLAEKIGLAPIVGAFAAGLVLDPVHFKSFREPKLAEEIRSCVDCVPEKEKKNVISVLDHHNEKHVEDLLEPVGYLLVPIFFVLTGINVKLETLFDPKILLVALAVTVVAFIGKIAAGAVAGKVNKWIVGVGMIPRGEVGLIFATIGKMLGVVSDEVYSVIVIMVILSTLIPPFILTWLLKRQTESAHA